MSVEITIQVGFDDAQRWILGILDTYEENKNEMMDKIAWYLEDTMYEEAPVGLTGRLRDSIRSEIIGDTVTVIPDIFYARFVVEGTSPSAGGYVPTLFSGKSAYPGARLTQERIGMQIDWEGAIIRGREISFGKGVHPGTPKNPFVDRTFERFIADMDDYINEIGDWWLYT